MGLNGRLARKRGICDKSTFMTEIPANTKLCRDCSEIVSLDAVTCPHCGAPRPARSEWSGEGYEWKSMGTWLGAPLVHVAFGIDHAGKPRTARGVIAIGQHAVGGLAIGVIARGFISLGVVSLGVVSFGVVSIAAVVAVGVNAIAPIAWGVAAMGYYAGGVEPLGWKILR